MSAVPPAPSLSPWFPPEPAGKPPPKAIRAVGLIGMGPTGAGIAHWCATKGMGVILHDEMPATLTQVVGVVRELFHAAEERGEITHAAAHKAVGGIGISTSLEDLEFCDVVIETVTEDLAAKRARFKALGRVMPPEAVLATGASAAGLEELFGAVAVPGRVLGLGFFDPVYASAEVQVTIGTQTTRVPVERVLGFVAALGKKPVLQGPRRPAG